jgi:hypothetical protein
MTDHDYPSGAPAASTSAMPSAAVNPAASLHGHPRPGFFPYPSTVNSSTSTLHQQPHFTAALEAEIARDEERVAAYGGDDPAAPTPKTPNLASIPQPPAISEPKADPDLVQWDGPDDPENPMNWSRSRRWIVTGVVILLSLNVYGYLPFVYISNSY